MEITNAHRDMSSELTTVRLRIQIQPSGDSSRLPHWGSGQHAQLYLYEKAMRGVHAYQGLVFVKHNKKLGQGAIFACILGRLTRLWLTCYGRGGSCSGASSQSGGLGWLLLRCIREVPWWVI